MSDSSETIPSLRQHEGRRDLDRRGGARLPRSDVPRRRPPAIESDHARRMHGRGVGAWRAGEPGIALALIDEALRHREAPPDWLVTRGMVLRDLGRRDEALLSFEDAADLDPGHAPAHAMRGALLAVMERPAEALASLGRAVALRPDDFALVRSRAVLLREQHHLAEALAGFEAAAALDAPDEAAQAMGHVDRAETLREMGRPLEALAAYDRAIEIHGDLAAARHGKGLLLLSLGRFAEGWPLHEWRWFVPGFPGGDRLFARMPWDGTALDGQTLFIHAEQGLGDALQFHRFVAGARQRGAVVLEVPAPLTRLFASQPDAPAIVPRGSPAPHFDRHCPLMSLPFLLGPEWHAPPAAPCLRADPAIVASWAARLPPVAGGPRIGLVWAGNARQSNDRNRSLPLRAMLAMLPAGVTAVPLQKDIPSPDRAMLRQDGRVAGLDETQADFADTAGMIANLDLVLSADTAVAHLAGALGKPVWITLAASADWRWMTDREDSPWYPSARLFRQTVPGDWADVIARVRRALEERFPA